METGWYEQSCIANRLNENGIFSPLEYKKSYGEHYSTGFQAGIVSNGLRWR